MQFWSWECDDAFDAMIIQVALEQQPPVKWVDFMGNPTKVSRGMAANAHLALIVDTVMKGQTMGRAQDLFFHDPDSFHPGELHRHVEYWEAITTGDLRPLNRTLCVGYKRKYQFLSLLNIIKVIMSVSPTIWIARHRDVSATINLAGLLWNLSVRRC